MKSMKKQNLPALSPSVLWLALCIGPVHVYAAQPARLLPNTASEPLIVQTRGNLAIAPNLLHSMSLKAGVPLQVTRKIGSGTYLLRPSRAVTPQGLRTIASRLAAHPNVLGAHIYQQSTPAYILVPAGHRLALNGARLSGSKTPLASYRWQQIAGPQTPASGTTRPVLTFLARQDASSTPVVSDPSAISPGDLSSAPPQAFQCAISAASVPRFTTRQGFMCNPGSTSGSPTPPTVSVAGPGTSTPPDNSGPPVTSTPPDNSGYPGAGTPPDNSGAPVTSTPPDYGNYPGSSTPPDNYGQPSGFNNPPSGGSPGGSGCNATANSVGIGVSNAVANNGGNATSNGVGIGAANATCKGSGNAVANSIGLGLSNSRAGMLSGMSVRKPMVANTAAPKSSIVGFRLIATDKAGVAHVRNIYVRVYRPVAATTAKKSAGPQPRVNPLKKR
jgi:hypothetical protein